ncbi:MULTISPECIES: hypothetical protein [Pseudoalteromonas]|uniref:Uncharacterized protein n=1 Tax=Pseudoalteromonas luteoviolacea (strain 2ta16) TaxID=1353533 RepID=V4HV89_PSEL2|nr:MULTISPECIES: hypothetical protein [Pseudoalteromonas]ESP93713.1 hypothetical protein PL2TA16_02917 [Pseudoalteromonas luteoviolacea 2ta16]KZN41170.1 hypothetical protein N483_16290 [Pseudoalteromonas luteoviolacea NCIMB 1944]MCG7550038.1 hypothetical protein [Pseudoalteromonas sp. Of7M-16]
MKKWILAVGLMIFCGQGIAKEPNTLFVVHSVTLNDQNKAKKRPYYEKGERFQIFNLESQSMKTIYQNKKIKSVYLEPGNYCFASVFISQSQRVPIKNKICFVISDEHINNMGTFVIGTRVAGKSPYALIVDIKQNYDEIAQAANQPSAKPVRLFKIKGS